MDVSSGQAREQLRAALEELGANPALFKDAHLDKLWANDYCDVSTLRDATRIGLKDAGLTPALIDHILKRTGGGAGRAVAAMGGVSAGLASGEPTTSLLEEVKVALTKMEVTMTKMEVTMTKMEVALTKMEVTLVMKMEGLMRPVSTIAVTPSTCSSGQRKQIESAVGKQWNYISATSAPCCVTCRPWPPQPNPQLIPQPKFSWSKAAEDAKENVLDAVQYLQSIVPEGVVVLPVQTIKWLNATMHVGDITVDITSSMTDYIFVVEAAWAKCRKVFGAELSEGWKLSVKSGTTTDALLYLLESIIGLYEAKTVKSLTENLSSVRAQALLEYLAVNHMKNWPTNDVIVLFGDFSRHFVVHGGRNDAGQPLRSIHVAFPAQLASVEEHEPATAEPSSPETVTFGFIRALLGTRRTEEAGRSGAVAGGSGTDASGGGGGAANNCEGGASGSGEGASGSRGGAANNHEGVASGSGEGASGSRGGAANNHEGGASGSGEGASGSGEGASGSGEGASGSRGGTANNRGRQAYDSGGAEDAGAAGCSNDAYSSTGAGSGGGEGSHISSADSSDGDGESFDGDEGLLEAARENAYMQACISLLRLPEVYEPLGLKEPPTSFRPPTKEEYLARFRPV